MFSRAKSLVKNHWKKVVYGGIAVQVASYGLRYAANRLMSYQEEQTKEVWLKMKKREHFERTYSNSVQTFVSLLPELRETIAKSLNVEVLTAALKERAANKLQIWEEMKCIAFSRVLASIYGCTLLNILLRIQLSVIGGYMLQDSFPEDAAGHPSGGFNGISNSVVDAQLQHDYLSVAHYFVKEGMQRLCSYIYEKCKAVVGEISLKRRLTVQELEQILWHIIDLIRRDNNESQPSTSASRTNTSSLGNYWKYVFPPEVSKRYDNFKHVADPAAAPEEFEDIQKQIMCETFDLLQSSDAASLITSFETHGVSHFLDRLVDIIAESQSSSLSNGDLGTSNGLNDSMSESTIISSESDPAINYNHLISDVTIPLAKLIPIFNSFAPNNLTEMDPFVLTSIQAETLRVFAANIYESFSSPISVPL